ncbi:hypothetical protein JI57_03015 [Psychromonas sp. PRT-SC03]|nr:hypothetical protein JI57_03015 [Psychromonas sp. PRT-SC03]
MPLRFQAYTTDLRLQLELKKTNFLMRNEEYVKARTLLLDILEKTPDEHDALILLGKINIKEKKYAQAHVIIEKLLINRPKQKNILLLQASL